MEDNAADSRRPFRRLKETCPRDENEATSRRQRAEKGSQSEIPAVRQIEPHYNLNPYALEKLTIM